MSHILLVNFTRTFWTKESVVDITEFGLVASEVPPLTKLGVFSSTFGAVPFVGEHHTTFTLVGRL
ncbi:hypothetical protein D3C87_1964110 [compost metagenome]